MEKKILLEIDHAEFTRMTSLLVDVFTEDLGTSEFDDLFKKVREKIPYLGRLMGACIAEMNLAQEEKEGPIETDTEALRRFLKHNDMFCFLQGAVVMLLTVAETLEKGVDSKSPSV
jgi:hypothetical protein